MVTIEQIKPDMPVVSVDEPNQVLARVDALEGKTAFRVKRDSNGLHHVIPLEWVSVIDDKVRIGKTAEEITADWKTAP